MKACIFEDVISGIEERLAKGRRALNATSGLGIRNNGLTILACCIIFWCVVVPIANYGAEFWILDNKRLKLIEAYQTFVGKRIQRLFSKAPFLSRMGTYRAIYRNQEVTFRTLNPVTLRG